MIAIIRTDWLSLEPKLMIASIRIDWPMDVTVISEDMSLISRVDEAQLAQLPTAFRLLPTS